MSVGILTGNVTALMVFQVSINLGNTATITTAVHSVTIPGLKVGDAIFVNKPSHSTGLGIANARVSAADTLEITTVNPTAGGIDPAAETYTILVARPETVATGIVT